MTNRRTFLVSSLILALAATLSAQPADPQPDPAAPNVFYGSVPAGGDTAPVLVFIHGLNSTASTFWTGGNDMYAMAYAAGYRTAFISMSLDNTPNTARISDNGAVIRTSLPYVLSNYNVPQVYFVGHSKGGLDTEFAVASYAGVRAATKAVFTLSTPNQGDALADWCFTKGKVVCKTLKLFNPGMADLRVNTVQAYRAAWDPLFSTAGIPFYTLGGDDYSGNPSTRITGPVLKNLTGEANDGLVTPTESELNPAYAAEMGIVHENHYRIATGSVSFAFIQARVPLQ